MSDRNYGALRDSESAINLLERIIASGKPFAFDIEAGYTGEDKLGVALQQFHPEYIVVGISFTVAPEWARYIPLAHDEGGNVDDLPAVARALWRFLRTGMGVAHNSAYELKGMYRFFVKTLWNDPEVGEEVRAAKGMFPILADTMLLVWLAAEYEPRRIGKDLKSVARAAFGMEMTKFTDLFPSVDSDLGPATKRGKTKVIRFNTRNAYSSKIIEYACEDSVASLLIFQKHYEALKDEPIFKVEMALLPILVEMERGPVNEDGSPVGNMFFDWPVIRRKAVEIDQFGKQMNEEIQQELGSRLGRTVNINLNSVPQLSKILFDARPEGLGLPVKKHSEKTGNPSTSDDALKVIAKTDPIIKKLLEYRQVVKLSGSYLTKFINELDYSGTGYVFPNHNQAGALTGRMSVDQVSYQQWPKPYHFSLASGRDFDLNFRDLFIAPKDFRIVGYDYANVELRVAGALSGETQIINAFNEGRDLHKTTAAAAFKIPFDAVDKKHRGYGKTLNFQILYGGGAAAVSDALSAQGDPVSTDQAQAMIDGFMSGYPKLAAWITRQRAQGREEKVVWTHFRRKFTVWEHYSPQEWMRAKGDRMTVNAPVQGTAADIIKIAMCRTANAIKKAGLEDKIRLTLTVHDALEFLVHDSISTQEVIDLVEPCVNFPISGFPLEIRSDWHEGKSWGSVVEIKLDKSKQITGYAIDGEDQEFSTVEEAYAFQSSKETKNKAEVLSNVPAPAVEEEEPDWFHSAEWHAAHPKLATVVITQMPTVSQWSRFLDFLAAHPGADTVKVETPEGILVLDDTAHLTLADQPNLSLILGGAALHIGTDQVDARDLMEGISL